jgi:hypothetical protein
MATMMWRSLGPDLDASSDKSLATLLHPQNRILPHIRDLYCIGADEQIRLLLLALPRDNLTEFQADSSVSPLTIQMLLQSQRKLQHLNVFVINDPALLDDGHVPFCDSQTWIKPLVKEVKTLKTYLPTSPGKTADSFRYYQFLLENIPSLKELCIDGYTEPNVPPTWIDLRIIMQEGLTTARFPQLTSLRLKLVDLGKSSQVLFSNFKFSGLAKLCLIGCDHMATFMDALLEYYNKNSEVLEELCISLPWHSSEPGADTHAIERFLKDGPKVQDLELDVSHHTLLDKACFIAQASSLKSLVLSTGRARQAKTYGVEEMKAILDACQKLKYLAVNLPEVRLGPIMDLADTFRLGKHRGDLTHVDTEFEAMLVSRRRQTPFVKSNAYHILTGIACSTPTTPYSPHVEPPRPRVDHHTCTHAPQSRPDQRARDEALPCHLPEVRKRDDALHG